MSFSKITSGGPWRRKKLLPLIILLLIIPSINISELFTIRDNASQAMKAISQEEQGDIAEISRSMNNVENTHNVFFELRNITENTDLYVINDHPFRAGGNFRDRLLGLGNFKELNFIKTEENIAISIDPNQLYAEGEVWVWPGHPRNDLPGRTWEIYTASKNVEEMVFISQDSDPSWIFIDAELLPIGFINGVKD